MKALFGAVLIVAALPILAAGSSVSQGGSSAVRQLEWKDLLPVGERAHYTPGPPPPAHDYLSGKRFGGMGDAEEMGSGNNRCDGIAAEFNENCGFAARQSPSIGVNRSLDGKTVKLPGYVVPLEVGTDGRITEFFLAAYLGACIHVPPPPPNQMVYVKLDRDLGLRSASDAYWITGILHTHDKVTGVAVAAYSLDAQKIEAFAR